MTTRHTMVNVRLRFATAAGRPPKGPSHPPPSEHLMNAYDLLNILIKEKRQRHVLGLDSSGFVVRLSTTYWKHLSKLFRIHDLSLPTASTTTFYLGIECRRDKRVKTILFQ